MKLPPMSVNQICDSKKRKLLLNSIKIPSKQRKLISKVCNEGQSKTVLLLYRYWYEEKEDIIELFRSYGLGICKIKPLRFRTRTTEMSE